MVLSVFIKTGMAIKHKAVHVQYNHKCLCVTRNVTNYFFNLIKAITITDIEIGSILITFDLESKPSVNPP